ncbi:cell death abnormality protein 1-like [Mytilus edulis]|uniref:cell death abnormality protein 1-like n=1 Tax=Mytilus edulis TaxID=6550 RepID=UPI0039EED2D6
MLYNNYRFNNHMPKRTIMKFLSRYVGICMMFTVYIAVSVEGGAYGASCTGNGTGDCTEKNNTVCNGTCKCTANSFRKSTPGCARKIALKQNCTAGQPADQCEDSNAACDGTALKCQCKSTHFVSKTGPACKPKIALKQICTAGQPADQCEDSNAACNGTALKCQCKSTHFVSKTGACKLVTTALKGACDTSDSFSHQCAVANAECRNEGTDKCLCKATHYVKGAACEIRKKPDEEGCAADECVTHATCNTKSNPTKCQCDTGYTATPTTTPTMCSGVPKVTTLSHMCVVPILLLMMFPLQ